VKFPDLYDREIIGFESIHSLSILHTLKLSQEDVNVNTTKVINNVPPPYEDKVDNCRCLKDNLECFIKWYVRWL